VALDQTLTDDLQAVVDEAVEELGTPGAVVLVTTADGARWETAVGVRDLDSGEPMTTGLRWPIRSITKSFTTTLVLQLADEGVVDLDAPISDWVPDVPNGDEVTLGQLMDMTSGLPDYTDQAFIEDFTADPTREFTTEELIAYATAQPARAEPGEDRVYTNSNTLLLGQVVEEATGRSFEEVLSERILEPLSLEDTTYPTSSEDWVSDAVGYSPDENGELSEDPVNFSVFGPAGAMISTTEDLARWGAALGTGELVAESTQADRQEGGPLDEGPEYDLYARGIGELDGWWGHTGEGFGFTSLAMHDPDTGTDVVIVMNSSQLESGHGPTVLFRRLAPLLSGACDGGVVHPGGRASVGRTGSTLGRQRSEVTGPSTRSPAVTNR
jgi:D-alanyl-D-alanine carboxypeptidase